MERVQDRAVGRPFKPAGVTMGHFVNLSESHLAYPWNGKTYCLFSQDFCMRMSVNMLLWGTKPSMNVSDQSADAVSGMVWEKGTHLLGWRKENYPLFNPNQISSFDPSKSHDEADILKMWKIKSKRLTSFYLLFWLLIGKVGTQHTKRSVDVKSNVLSAFSFLWAEPLIFPLVPAKKKCLAEYHFTSLINCWFS